MSDEVTVPMGEWEGSGALVAADPPSRTSSTRCQSIDTNLQKLLHTSYSITLLLRQAFFSTPAAEKTKTQGKNSRKNSTLGEQFLPLPKTQEKNLSFRTFSLKTELFSWDRLFMPFFSTKSFKIGRF